MRDAGQKIDWSRTDQFEILMEKDLFLSFISFPKRVSALAKSNIARALGAKEPFDDDTIPRNDIIGIRLLSIAVAG